MKKKHSSVLNKFLTALSILGLIILFAKVNLTQAQDAEDCLATIDTETGGQTNPDCPAPASENGSVTAVLANLHKLDPSCSPPTVKKGSQCVLQNDLTLTNPLGLASFTQLNCQGHKLTPFKVGTMDDATTEPENEFSPSQPEVAIVLDEVFGTKIQNCVIEGFDLGFLSINTKFLKEFEDDPGALGLLKNKFLHNTVNVRTTGIYLLASDNTLIADNHITYNSQRGRGAAIEKNSDYNELIGNTFTSTDLSGTGRVTLLPGSTVEPSPAMMDIKIHSVQGVLYNIIIAGQLTQFGNRAGYDNNPEDNLRPDHNLIEGNTIQDDGFGPSSFCTKDPSKSCINDANCVGKGSCLATANHGIAMNARSADTIIRTNTIGGKNFAGIFLSGITANDNVTLEGGCHFDSSRLCVDPMDCNIPGYDSGDNGGDKGPCDNPPPETAPINALSANILAEGNTIFGQNTIFGPSIAEGIRIGPSENSTLRGNFIRGPMRVGIDLRGVGLMTGTVEDNKISAATNGIHLTIGAATFFGAKVSLNDITGYTNAVQTTNGYPSPFSFLSEFSVDDQGNICGPESTGCRGNYWGLDNCLLGGFDPNSVKSENGTINTKVVDSHPYGVPVAELDDALLPTSFADGYCSAAP